MFKSLVGCCFQRTKKSNTHKTTPRRKAFLTLWTNLFFLPNIGAMAIAPYGNFNIYPFGFVGVFMGKHPTKLFFLPIFILGALKTAPYGDSNDIK